MCDRNSNRDNDRDSSVTDLATLSDDLATAGNVLVGEGANFEDSDGEEFFDDEDEFFDDDDFLDDDENDDDFDF